MKKYIRILSMFLIIASFCAILDKSMAQVTASAKTTTTKAAAEKYHGDNKELAQASKLGLIPKGWLDNPKGKVTPDEFINLVAQAVKLRTKKTWNFQIICYDGSKYIDRCDAAQVLYISALNNIYEVKNTKEFWCTTDAEDYLDKTSSLSSANCNDPVEFLEFITKNDQRDLNNKGQNFGAVKFACRALAKGSRLPLLTMNADGYARAKDFLTKEEAILAAYRLYDLYDVREIKLTYKPLADVPKADFSASLIKKAYTMPEATEEKLPNWHGINLSNLEIQGGSFGLSNLYSEDQVKLVSKMGFNFVRVPLTMEVILNKNKTEVVMNYLDSMDQLVAWGIENKIHVCFDLHYYVDHTYDLEAMKAFWSMMAHHYVDIPSNALSFNIINEPSGSDADVNAMNEMGYNAVRAIDNDRLIFCDGLMGNFSQPNSDLSKGGIGGVSKLPSLELAKYDVAQTFHWYMGAFNGDYWLSHEGYLTQNSWPYPFVSAQIFGKNPMLIDGSFTKGETVKIYVDNYNPGDTLVAYLDGIEIKKLKISDDSRELDFKLPKNGKELKIAVDNWIMLSHIDIIHNEIAKTPIPYYEASGYWYKKLISRYEKHLVTSIICEGSSYYDNMVSHVTVNKDGSYTSYTECDGPAYLYDYGVDGLSAYTKLWSDFSKANDKPVMCQEFGFYCTPASEKVELKWMDAWLTALDKESIPWSCSDWERLVSTNNPKNSLKGATWIRMGKFWVNKELLEVYRAHMK